MRTHLLSFALLAVMAVPAVASEQTAVMAPIQQFVDGFNKGDMSNVVAACDANSSVIDDFPPHVWAAPSGCADWGRAYARMAKSQGITNGIVTLGTPRHVDVTGDRAYVVVPTTFTYKLHGKATTEAGSSLTIALRKVGAGWRITGWAWTKH